MLWVIVTIFTLIFVFIIFVGAWMYESIDYIIRHTRWCVMGRL